jgi:hypothetical protein
VLMSSIQPAALIVSPLTCLYDVHTTLLAMIVPRLFMFASS